MKRTLFLLMVSFCVIAMQAQPAKGKLFAGGSLSFSTNTNKDKDGSTTVVNQKYFGYGIEPTAGFFLTDKIAIGAHLGLNGNIYKNPENLINKSRFVGFTFSPFGRYYLTSGDFGVFLEGKISATVGSRKMFSDAGSTTQQNYSLETAISPGVYYYIKPKFVIEATLGSIGFSTSSQDYSDNSTEINTGFNFDLRTGLSLGFTVILN